jgi:hypothetical protein
MATPAPSRRIGRPGIKVFLLLFLQKKKNLRFSYEAQPYPPDSKLTQKFYHPAIVLSSLRPRPRSKRTSLTAA